MRSGNEIDVPNAENFAKLLSGHLHGSGGGRRSWRGLRKCRRHCRMERHVSFYLLHHLMNVSVEHGHRAEALEQVECLRAIFGGPAPLRIYGPQRNVGEDYDRSAGRQPGHIVLEPRQLLLTNRAQAFELRGVVQPDEMNTFVVEALPTVPGRALAETLHV